MGAIFFLSSWHNVPDLPAGFSNHTGHFIGYGLLGALALRAFAFRHDLTVAAAGRAIVLASAYGVTDEFHQSFVSNRTPAADDWIADTTGAAAAVLLILWAARTRQRRAGK